MRSMIVVLLLVGPLPAETRVDFSGVFLRTATTVGKKRLESEPPRILVISQTPVEIVVKAIQNGETAVAHYPLEAKKSDKVQAKLKGRSLVLTFNLAELETSVSEKWLLSPDGQQLTIQGEQGPDNQSDIYLRKPTLEEAQASVNLAVKSACKRPFPFPQKTKKNESTYQEGTLLGMASYQQVTHCVLYDAVLSGDFFKNLEGPVTAGAAFRKNGRAVTEFDGDLTLEVEPHGSSCSATSDWVSVEPRPPDAVRDLRFMVRWMGSAPRDLGEVQAELRHEPWRETNASQDFYRIRIPAEGVPLADSLEVLIFSRHGEELACIRGHI
jgi:hypothetical protein